MSNHQKSFEYSHGSFERYEKEPQEAELLHVISGVASRSPKSVQMLLPELIATDNILDSLPGIYRRENVLKAMAMCPDVRKYPVKVAIEDFKSALKADSALDISFCFFHVVPAICYSSTMHKELLSDLRAFDSEHPGRLADVISNNCILIDIFRNPRPLPNPHDHDFMQDILKVGLHLRAFREVVTLKSLGIDLENLQALESQCANIDAAIIVSNRASLWKE